MENEKKLREQKAKIDRKISDIEYKKLIEVSIPQLKKSVGKCFKYHNSYGSNYPRWFLYSKIVSIDEKNMSFKTVEFQKTSMNFVEIKFSQKYNFNGKSYFNSGDYIEIKKSEYERAKKGILKTVQKILKL